MNAWTSTFARPVREKLRTKGTKKPIKQKVRPIKEQRETNKPKKLKDELMVFLSDCNEIVKTGESIPAELNPLGLKFKHTDTLICVFLWRLLR